MTLDSQLSLSLERVIERRGFGDVIIAFDRAQACALLDSIVFETAIVDASLPRREGMALLLELATRCPTMRRVAMGQGSRGILDRLIEGGLADAAVAAPVDVDELLEAAFGVDPQSRPHRHQDRVPLSRATTPREQPHRDEGEATPEVIEIDFTPVRGTPCSDYPGQSERGETTVIELGAPVEVIDIDFTPIGEALWLATAVDRARARGEPAVPHEVDIEFTPASGRRA